jgi:hypothetical protein
MVQRLVEFPLQDGGSVLVQVDDPPAANGGVTRGWRDGDLRVLEQSELSFEKAVAKVQPAVQSLVGGLRSMPDPPAEIEVEFGMQLSAEVGAFVAGISSAGNFKVSVMWRSRSDPGAP